MKKFLSFILSCTMCFSVAIAAGCGNDNTSAPVPVVEKLEMGKTNLLLTLGDRMQLPVSYNVLEGESLTWKSSSPSVVSVDQNGFVEGLKVGSATITAEYGTKQVSCKVEVDTAGNVPTLSFGNNVREEITIMKGTEFALGACVRFNGKTFTDGEIEYYVADKTVGDVVDGKFVANGIVGSTQVSVVATWRGLTVQAETVTVNVVPETTVLLDGGMLTSIDLYTVTTHEDVEYATSQTISSVFVSEDGEEVAEYTLSILDEGIATLEKAGDTWNIKANKAGKTNLIVAYGGKEVSFDVTVARPVKALDMEINYSIADGKYFDEETQSMKPVSEIIDGFEGMVSYALDGKEYKLKDGKLDIAESVENTVIFYNDTVGYQATCSIYTKIIDELQDFVGIYAGKETKLITGTYMLARDIIEPYTILSFPEGMKPNNFGGYFDGKGHVLTFTFNHSQEYRCGLFGQFLEKATIKNLALHNIAKNGTSGKAPAGILCGEGGQDDSEFSTLENIYASVYFIDGGASNLAFMGNAMWKVNLKNVIVYAPDVPVADTYGGFARGEVASTSNSYVISNAPLYKTTQATNFRVVPTLFADYNAFKSAGCDFDSFSVEFWDVTTYGIPVWKTLVDDFSDIFNS